MGESAESAQHLEHGGVGRAGLVGRQAGGERIRKVSAAGRRELVQRDAQRIRPIARQHQVSGDAPGAALEGTGRREESRPPRGALGHRVRPAVVRVRHERVVGLLEQGQAFLRRSVRAKIVVAVQVVGCQVEQYGDVRAQVLGVFELEARELRDDPVGGFVDQRRERRTQVSADWNAQSARAQHLSNEHHGGALAVRSGHADQGRVEVLGGQLYLGQEAGVSLEA